MSDLTSGFSLFVCPCEKRGTNCKSKTTGKGSFPSESVHSWWSAGQQYWNIRWALRGHTWQMWLACLWLSSSRQGASDWRLSINTAKHWLVSDITGSFAVYFFFPFKATYVFLAVKIYTSLFSIVTYQFTQIRPLNSWLASSSSPYPDAETCC